MKQLLTVMSIIILSTSINTYSDNIVDGTATISEHTTTATQANSIKKVLRSIHDDFDFYNYMAMKGITDDEVDKALYSKECIAYIREELKTEPKEEDVSANWDIWKWHIDKIEAFLEQLFSSGNSYNSSGNGNSKNNNGYSGDNNNGYNNMMPPPIPYSNNNQWGQYPPMPPNPYNNNYGMWRENEYKNSSCNCKCSNCSKCLFR